MGGGDLILTATGATSSLLVNAPVSSTSVTTATAGAAITESGSGTFTSVVLTTSSVTGETLGDANAVAEFNANNTTSGSIGLTNTITTLTVTGISQTGGGSVTVNNTAGDARRCSRCRGQHGDCRRDCAVAFSNGITVTVASFSSQSGSADGPATPPSVPA